MGPLPFEANVLANIYAETERRFTAVDDFAHGWEHVNRVYQLAQYIAEQEDGEKPAYVCVRDGRGNVLARLESRHIHGVGVDSRGDIYAGLTTERSVDKFVRKG